MNNKHTQFIIKYVCLFSSAICIADGGCRKHVVLPVAEAKLLRGHCTM